MLRAGLRQVALRASLIPSSVSLSLACTGLTRHALQSSILQPVSCLSTSRCFSTATPCESTAGPAVSTCASTVTPPSTRSPQYITTPIFYVNGAPHIGHLYTMLLGDSIARWHRAKGDDVFFMAGTDEHGAKVEEAAQKAGFSSTLAFCDEVSKSFQDAWKQFDISHDAFLRTTSAEHRDSVQHIWRVLEQRGYIYKGQHEGWYCRSDEAFVPETQLLKVPVQEGRPASAPAGEGLEWRTASGHAVERISEDNYKFRLSRFAPLLLDYYAAHPQAIQPEAMRATVMGMLQAGLDDISVSRLASKLQWGIDVPGDDEHKVYVWLDALNIYLTGARAATARARTQGTIEDLLARASSAYSGPTAANTRPSTPETAALLADVEAHAAEARADPALAPFATDCDPFWPSGTQIIGKDIVKFHCIYWPAFLLAAGLPLPEKTLAHSHWTVEGQKMSKSLGNVLAPQLLMDKYGVDNTRYGLLRTGNIRADINFSETDFIGTVNNGLSDILGNLAMRATSPPLLPTQRYPDPLAALRPTQEGDFDANAPIWYRPDPSLFTEAELALQAEIDALPGVVDHCMRAHRLDDALVAVADVGRTANLYVAEVAPWKLMKKGVPVDEAAEGRVQMVLYHALETVRVSALCLQHVLPAAANKLLDDIAVPASQRNPMKFGRFGWRPRVISPEDTEKNEDCGRAQVSVAPFTKIVPPAAKPETKKNAPKEGPSRKERKAQYKKQMQMAEAN